jgi:hypothetical protein
LLAPWGSDTADAVGQGAVLRVSENPVLQVLVFPDRAYLLDRTDVPAPLLAYLDLAADAQLVMAALALPGVRHPRLGVLLALVGSGPGPIGQPTDVNSFVTIAAGQAALVLDLLGHVAPLEGWTGQPSSTATG